MRIAILSLFLVACVPADHALPLGSLEFEMKASHVTMEGIPFTIVDEGWEIHVQRALFALKTVTIGETKVPDKCSYRGRGELSDVVFDIRYGNTQVFNGLEATDCPDVGFVFAPPSGVTVPGAGATGADLQMLADGDPAHAYIEMTATKNDEIYRLALRFETLRTSSRFGGCHTDVKGITVKSGKRQKSTIAFTVDALFRESSEGNAKIRFQPFITSDVNGDHFITMQELDTYAIAQLNQDIPNVNYHLQDGSIIGSFGEFVRAQMKFAWFFDADGACVGDEPGTEEPQ
jgi:hypothetical protein